MEYLNDNGKPWESNSGETPYEMKTSILKKIARTIDFDSRNETLKSEFCSEGFIETSEISITVDEIGQLTFPVDQATARKLIKLSSQTDCDQNEKTLLNKNVGDIHMIPADKLSVKILVLPQLMEHIKTSLRLDQSCIVETSLFNMLIYETGQSFEYHRNLKKMDNVIAMLIIALPSEHQGGDLIIQHMLNYFNFSSAANTNPELSKFVAYFADCRRNVEKVTEGYRIVLTYNIILKSGDKNLPIEPPEKLTSLIETFFSEDEEPPVEEHNLEDGPRKLVFLLDSKYAPGGLTWGHVHGDDSKKAGLLINVANKLKLKVFIARVDIKETWSGTYDEFEYFLSLDTKLKTLHDLDDYENVYAIELRVRPEELCYNVENKKKFEPYNKVIEITGSKSTKVECCYERAAVILWPEQHHYKFLMLLNYDETFANLYRLIEEPNRQSEVKELTMTAGDYLYGPPKSPTCRDVNPFVNLAIYIDDEEAAADVVAKVIDSLLIPISLGCFCKLLTVYGIDWCQNLIDSTKIATKKISAHIINFAYGLYQINNCQLVGHILHQQLAAGLSTTTDDKSDFLNVLRGFVVTNIDPLTDDIKHHLQKSILKCQGLAKAIQMCSKDQRLTYLSVLNCLRETVVDSLYQHVAKCNKQLQSGIDWSIEYPFPSCQKDCFDCSRMKDFLKSPKRILHSENIHTKHFKYKNCDGIIEVMQSYDLNSTVQKKICVVEKTHKLFIKINEMKENIKILIESIENHFPEEKNHNEDVNGNPIT